MIAAAPLTVPAFPLLGDPGDWDELTLGAATVFLETEGEPWLGQLAVAHVIGNRMAVDAKDAKAVILGPDRHAYDDGHAYEVFSCWNDDYRARAHARLAAAGAIEWAWRAAAAGLWSLGDDPSRGAYFYLNEAATKAGRGGTLPSWFDEKRVTCRIGRHAFLRS